nr:suppressor of fused domain protein [Neisseria polysaccharea]
MVKTADGYKAIAHIRAGDRVLIVFPLLVPLYKQEAELVEKKGWNAFEQFLLDNEVGNLSDMNRKPFVW